MNEYIKDRWTEALRSGRYHKNVGYLRRRVLGEPDQFCALGVLCDLYAQDHPCEKFWVEPAEGQDGPVYTASDDWMVLPYEVMRWAGLGHHNPRVEYDRDYPVPLSELNDGSEAQDIQPLSFDQLADVIDEQL